MYREGSGPAAGGTAFAFAESPENLYRNRKSRDAAADIFGSFGKRLIDVTGSTVLIVSLSPVLLMIAIATWFSCDGKVLFFQKRYGYAKRPFRIVKFRTMNVAEDGAAVRQATIGDPRVTRWGRILRATSLDELPQLFNVLMGHMSLVGPRPHAIVHDEAFSRIVPGYDQRFLTRPGITGLAQIRGYRGPTTTTRQIVGRVASDLEYIRTWSLPADLWILVATVKAVLARRNAY